MDKQVKLGRRKPNVVANHQNGFTLIELLVGLAITALIVGGISTGIYQVTTINSSDSSRMTAVKQVEIAVDTIRQDAIESQKTDVPASSTLILTSIRWDDNKVYSITYYLSGNNLMRDESVDGALTSSKSVAHYIGEFSPSKDSTSGKINVVLSATVDSLRSATETRTFDIFPRSASS